MAQVKFPPFLSRREFLKLSGVGFAASFLPALELGGTAETGFGRVTERFLSIYSQPSFTSRHIKQVWQDAVLPICDTVAGQADSDQPESWFQIGGIGYAPASFIQPVEIRYQEPTDQISRQGSLSEVTVPIAEVYEKPDPNSRRLYRYYYGSNHWVDRVTEDSSGQVWYRVIDDKFEDQERWVRASRLRVIPFEELAPISPLVPADQKRIEVSLTEQRMTAYEYDKPVFTTLVSTGATTENNRWVTPTGRFLVGFKRASQHMLPWDSSYGDYDLPGVPWVTYYAYRAVAFHGAYWHNGFGRPRSHGCVNLKPQDARWVFLWTTPTVLPYDQMEYAETGGTFVEVFD